MSDKTEPEHFPKSFYGKFDGGDGREERERLRSSTCLARMSDGRLCTLADGHDDDHASDTELRPLAPNDFGPAQAGRRGWGR